MTVSTDSERGAVLSDDNHYVGCSLFPTREITAARTASAGTTAAAFGWALNPIGAKGESLWAAGYLPDTTLISYGLPDGSTVNATVSKAGYRMVKTHRPGAFDTEENVDDWLPVTVKVTRSA